MPDDACLAERASLIDVKVAADPSLSQSNNGGFAPAVVDDLLSRGHLITQSAPEASGFFGGAQLVWRTEDGYLASSDHRTEGQAVGY